MPTYRIDYPDGTSETTTADAEVTHAVVIQGKRGEAWATWNGYDSRVDAANEAAYLVGFSKMHAVKVVPVTAT